jgi:hypothetical protein
MFCEVANFAAIPRQQPYNFHYRNPIRIPYLHHPPYYNTTQPLAKRQYKQEPDKFTGSVSLFHQRVTL